MLLVLLAVVAAVVLAVWQPWRGWAATETGGSPAPTGSTRPVASPTPTPTETDAETEAGRQVAVPGTSEHQLGLAVDIVDLDHQLLDEGIGK